MSSRPLKRCPTCDQPLAEEKRARRRKRRADKETNRYDARRFVRLAIKAGMLKRGACEYAAHSACQGQIEAHHYLGYEPRHWLDVVWCCTRHHRIADQMDPEGCT